LSLVRYEPEHQNADLASGKLYRSVEAVSAGRLCHEYPELTCRDAVEKYPESISVRGLERLIHRHHFLRQPVCVGGIVSQYRLHRLVNPAAADETRAD